MADTVYHRIFDALPEALLLYALSGESLASNPAACRLLGYTAEECRHLPLRQLIHPDWLPSFSRLQEAVAAGEEFQAQGRLVRKDGASFTAEIKAAPFTAAGQPGVLLVIRDVTFAVASQRFLEQQAAEQTQELKTLLEISHNITLTLDMTSLLGMILEQLARVIAYDGATVLVLEGEHLIPRAYRGPAPADVVLRTRYSIHDATSQAVLHSQESLIVADMQQDALTKSQAAPAARELFETSLSYVRGWMATAITIKGRAVGILIVHHRQPNAFTEAHAEKIKAFAYQAAVVIENARLYEAKQRRAEQFRIISEVGQRITSILALDELLSQTVRLIQEAFGYYHIHIGLIDGEYVTFKSSAGVWGSEPACLCCHTRLRVGQEGLSGLVAASGIPILSPDVQQDTRYIPVVPGQSGSNVVLPLKVKGLTIGVLVVESREINAFDADDLIVLQLLANQIATAIENTRLYEQAQQLAALQERQKLARELHDSVSQALYGIGLGARTARVLLPRDPARAIEPVEYVLSLAEAGLAEMRALIFELRPESLAKEGLVAALEKQAAVLRARHQMEVTTFLSAEPPVPLPVKEAFFRIAQEALHNVVKHAGASRVELRLQPDKGQLLLEIRDNGQGFDTSAAFPGHLGLQSMRERIERLGGEFHLDSAPGEGTVVAAALTLPASPLSEEEFPMRGAHHEE